LVEHPGEQRVIARMRRLRSQKVPLRVVAERLNADGARQRHGGLWTRQAISRTLDFHEKRRAATARP
jgi:hypothetical protein